MKNISHTEHRKHHADEKIQATETFGESHWCAEGSGIPFTEWYILVGVQGQDHESISETHVCGDKIIKVH